jgi:hypothetical protein
MSRSPRRPAARARAPDPALVRAASLLIGEGVDLSQIPDDANKTEFLELASLALQDKIGSLQKARLEVLSHRLEEAWDRVQRREEIEKQRAEAQARREKRDKMRRLLKRRTRKGQPILRNLAKVQLQQVRDIIEREKQQK